MFNTMWLYRADQVALKFWGFFHAPRLVETLTNLSMNFVRKKFHEKWVILASEGVKICNFRPQQKILLCGLKKPKMGKMVKKMQKKKFFFPFWSVSTYFGAFLGP